DAEEGRQDGLANLSLEGAPVLVVVLALALEAVPDGLVEEDARGLRREDRGPGVGIERRRLPQSEQLLHHGVDLAREILAAGKLRLAHAVEVAAVVEQH